ncbi:hypothetical protein EV175_005433 [Coemansia sp. RSA 1933]|nr:hypothetical protein EV175_005433 [Coemansia sp. RSA 1933]
MVVDAQPKQKQQQLDTRDAAPDYGSNQARVPAKQAQPVSSEEDGEIDVEPNEEGECVEDRHPPSSPRARDSSSSSHRRYSDYHHRSARRQSSHSRADYYYQQGSRHDRPPSRGRTSRYDDRERSPYSRHSRDEWGLGRRSSGYRDSGYRDRRRSRSRSRSRGRSRADPYGRADSYGRADPYGSSPMHVAQPPLPPPAPQHQLRMAPNGIMISPPHQPPPPPVAINPFQPVDFGSPMPQQQNRMDVCDDDHYPYQHPRQHDRRHDDYRYQR